MQGLAEALSLSTLIAGTLEYAILVRHRGDQRRGAVETATTEQLGHEALLRMRLLEARRPPRSWTGLGTRFR